METTIVYWGSLGTMEKKMEATIIGFGIRVFWEGFSKGSRPLVPHRQKSSPKKTAVLLSIEICPGGRAGCCPWHRVLQSRA